MHFLEIYILCTIVHPIDICYKKMHSHFLPFSVKGCRSLLLHAVRYLLDAAKPAQSLARRSRFRMQICSITRVFRQFLMGKNTSFLHQSSVLAARYQQRIVWRNDRSFYHRTCDSTGEDILSMFSPDKARPVYSTDIWWSDSWNPRDFGREYDFDRPFFEQWRDLMQVVPLPALSMVRPTIENSDYCQSCWVHQRLLSHLRFPILRALSLWQDNGTLL